MDKNKLQTLIYDIQRSSKLEDAHQLILDYVGSLNNDEGDLVQVDHFGVDTIFKGATEAKVRVQLIVPLNKLKDDTFTFKNIMG